MYSITFHFEQNGLQSVMLENIDAGQTLLEIALQNDIELHHNCGGVCSCTTCHIYIDKGMENTDEKSSRESDFLSKAANPKINSRLACQSLLLDGSGEVIATIPDQSNLPDEYF